MMLKSQDYLVVDKIQKENRSIIQWKEMDRQKKYRIYYK
jgi:hypothetical protein